MRLVKVPPVGAIHYVDLVVIHGRRQDCQWGLPEYRVGIQHEHVETTGQNIDEELWTILHHSFVAFRHATAVLIAGRGEK